MVAVLRRRVHVRRADWEGRGAAVFPAYHVQYIGHTNCTPPFLAPSNRYLLPEMQLPYRSGTLLSPFQPTTPPLFSRLFSERNALAEHNRENLTLIIRLVPSLRPWPPDPPCMFGSSLSVSCRCTKRVGVRESAGNPDRREGPASHPRGARGRASMSRLGKNLWPEVARQSPPLAFAPWP